MYACTVPCMDPSKVQDMGMVQTVDTSVQIGRLADES